MHMNTIHIFKFIHAFIQICAILSNIYMLVIYIHIYTHIYIFGICGSVPISRSAQRRIRCIMSYTVLLRRPYLILTPCLIQRLFEVQVFIYSHPHYDGTSAQMCQFRPVFSTLSNHAH